MVVEKLKVFPILGIFLFSVVLVLLIVSLYYFYDNVKLPYFLTLVFFLSISTAIYFYFYSFSNERLLLLIVLYLVGLSLIYYTSHKILSFFFLYVVFYVLYFYSISKITAISSTLLSYFFYLSLFFLYHFYFTFTKQFILRTYSIIKFFFVSSRFMKLVLWVLFILFPTLVNNLFVFLLVFNQLLVLAFLADHTIILFYLILLYIWFSFLSISNYFNVFSKVRRKIVKYFSRKACLHFIGNAPGSKLSEHLPAVLIAVMTTVPAIAGPLNDATTSANKAGQAAIDNYKLINPNASP